MFYEFFLFLHFLVSRKHDPTISVSVRGRLFKFTFRALHNSNSIKRKKLLAIKTYLFAINWKGFPHALIKKYSARLCTHSQDHLITWEAPILGMKAGIVTLDAYNRRNKSTICDGKLIYLKQKVLFAPKTLLFYFIPTIITLLW